MRPETCFASSKYINKVPGGPNSEIIGFMFYFYQMNENMVPDKPIFLVWKYFGDFGDGLLKISFTQT